MTYEEAVRALERISERGIKPGLSRVRALLSRLGRPDLKFPSVIVGGTNGKGSICAFLSNILIEAGLKVGLYTSPHLLQWRERMAVDGELVSPEEFGGAVGEALRASKGMRDKPTPFEVLTAAALWLFAQKGVDIAVLEVGMGGRWDATNATRNVLASIVSNVGLDHTQWLGDTVEEIAVEKAWIARRGKPFITSALPGEGREVLLQVAKGKGATPLVVGNDEGSQARVRAGPRGSFSVEFEGRVFRCPKPGIEGRRQPLNAACAVVCSMLLGVNLPEEAIGRAIGRTSLPGRFQILDGSPTVVLDVAHNAEAAKHLAQTLESRFPGRKALLVCAMFSDKPHLKFAEALRPIASRAFVAPMTIERPFPAEALAEEFRRAGIGEVRAFKSIRGAFEAALSEAREREVVLVCGSFVTVGEALKILRGRSRANREKGR
ncbi:MAG TPA: bifunctional folylpolyglutamate synthase/dihydrofolate synthase [Armatimonadetes bacterium]|nr:bifunctional folylpolyglutamate synthase/dihydrofolate synthase [Armatimonadota bacterium]